MIVAYTFQAETLCHDCIFDKVVEMAVDVPNTSPHMSNEELLDAVAAHKGIDREDEHSFDSDEFPKVVFDHQLDPLDRCSSCHEEL